VRGQRDLRLVAWLAPVCAALALAIPLAGVSLLFAAPLALLLPGYAIVAAAFARRPLEAPQVLLLSMALSLCVLALGGLLLNYLPGGIRDLSWAALLILITLGGCRAAALRRTRQSSRIGRPRLRMRRRDAALLLGGVAAAGAAIVLSASSFPAEHAVGYTQLWIVPAPGSGEARAQVGVKSDEQRPVDYDLRVKIGEEQPEVVRRSFVLRPGEERVVNVGPASAPPGARVPVTAALLRHNRPFSVYRRVKASIVAPAQPR
jgi:uncharacterized membrane protein